MTSSLVICTIPEDVKDTLKKFRFSKSQSTNVLVLKISKEEQVFAIEEHFEDVTLEEVRDELPSQQPRFVLISWCKKHDDGRSSYPLSLVYYSPTGSSPELKMLYAGSKNHLIQECQLTKNMEIRDLEDLTEELLESK